MSLLITVIENEREKRCMLITIVRTPIVYRLYCNMNR